MGDVFADRIRSSLDELRKDETVKARVKVSPEAQFVGFDAYKNVIASCDVVLLCSTPHFRPVHLAEAIDKKKHVFCEKPVAVDAPGVRSVLESSRRAKEAGLALMSGFCWRYSKPAEVAFGKVLDGAIGRVETIHTRYLTGNLGLRKRQPQWSDMEYQLRNWYYYTWASGDHIVEQAIHSINKIAWAMNDETPIHATAVGGRQVRTGPEYGNVYDHFAVVYEYKGGQRGFHDCRQTEGCYNDNGDFVAGTKGTLTSDCWGPKHEIRGERPWHWEGDPGSGMYLHEHEVLFASIRKGEPVNDGVMMSHSTLMAIMGRMAAYTGARITWDEALNSKEDLTPPSYEWGPLPVAPIAVPGRTKLA
jgi:predicted dehydrogenase